jgi:Flp pilus assembly protein TadD
VDRIIRICSFSAALALTAAAVGAAPVAAHAADSDADVDLFWQAQRAELGGQPASALKSYNRLLGQLPESSVAVDRLFDTAILHGDFASALKAARAQQLAETGDAASPLIFFVDAWKRKDWTRATDASSWLQQGGVFSFMAPILNAWVQVGQGKKATLSNATLQESGLLGYYSMDQMVYLDLANDNGDSAKTRLASFPGFGEDYARHMAMSAAEQLARSGNGDFVKPLLQHIGAEPLTDAGKPGAFPADQALAALFSRLSAQLAEQGINDQALYFARLANWISPDSAFGRMTLASRLADKGRLSEAIALLDGIGETRPQWSWALGDKARLLLRDNRARDALNLIQSARTRKPKANDLKLLEAQQLEANGDMAGAAAIYRSLIADADAQGGKNGRRVTFRMLLAQVLDTQENWPASKAALEEALVLNNENPQLLNSLGYRLLERREDVKRGFELVSKAHRLAPQSPAITDSLGWGHYLNGDYAKAVPLLEMAVENAISDVTINEHLGDAYWKVGRFNEARYSWRAASLQANEGEGKRIAAKIDLGWTEATAAP